MFKDDNTSQRIKGKIRTPLPQSP